MVGRKNSLFNSKRPPAKLHLESSYKTKGCFRVPVPALIIIYELNSQFFIKKKECFESNLKTILVICLL